MDRTRLLLKKMMVVKVKALKGCHELNGLCKGAKGTSNSDGSEVNKSDNVHGKLLRDVA